MEYLDKIHTYFEETWEKVYEQFGHNEKLMFVAGTSMVLFLSFCGINILFTSLDVFGTPRFLRKYKVQKDKNVPVDPMRYLNCVRVSLSNELMTCGFVYLLYPVMRSTGMSCQNPLPSIWKVPFQFFANLVCAEVVFYYSHRLFHSPYLYKHIHKKHHEWIAPISIAASYAHPLEHIISNALPILVGPIITGSHLSVTWLWLMMSQIDTCLHHSNYHLPFLSSPQFHDYHHLKFNENFGFTGWLDSFHSTNVNYKKAIQSKRHITFYDLIPITEKFPSSNEKEN